MTTKTTTIPTRRTFTIWTEHREEIEKLYTELHDKSKELRKLALEGTILDLKRGECHEALWDRLKELHPALKIGTWRLSSDNCQVIPVEDDK